MENISHRMDLEMMDEPLIRAFSKESNGFLKDLYNSSEKETDSSSFFIPLQRIADFPKISPIVYCHNYSSERPDANIAPRKRRTSRTSVGTPNEETMPARNKNEPKKQIKGQEEMAPQLVSAVPSCPLMQETEQLQNGPKKKLLLTATTGTQTEKNCDVPSFWANLRDVSSGRLLVIYILAAWSLWNLIAIVLNGFNDCCAYVGYYVYASSCGISADNLLLDF